MPPELRVIRGKHGEVGAFERERGIFGCNCGRQDLSYLHHWTCPSPPKRITGFDISTGRRQAV